MNIAKKIFSFLAFCLAFSSLKAKGVFAQIGDSSVGVGGDATGWFEDVIIWIIGLAGLVAVAVLVFNGFMYITASGDEGKVQKATKGITYAVVGLVIAAIAFIIVNFIIDAI